MPVRGIGEIPLTVDSQLRRVLVDIRQNVVNLIASQQPPEQVTDFKVTPGPFNNTIQFSRTGQADFYVVLFAPTPSLSDPQIVRTNINDANQWVHQVGKQGVTFYYWITSYKFNGQSSQPAGPLGGVTLASTTGVTPPIPPPPAQIIVTDLTTGRQIPYTVSKQIF